MRRIHWQPGSRSGGALRDAFAGRVAAGALLVAGASGILLTILFDAPYLSILIVGLLLICPLLMLAPRETGKDRRRGRAAGPGARK